jgi:hypothetical protein
MRATVPARDPPSDPTKVAVSGTRGRNASWSSGSNELVAFAREPAAVSYDGALNPLRCDQVGNVEGRCT